MVSPFGACVNERHRGLVTVTTFLRGHLLIKGCYAKKVLEGTKTTTIRMGKVVVKSKDLIIHSGGRPIAKAVVTRVVYKMVRELTEEDAKRDGHENLSELLKALERMYGKPLSPEDVVTIIEFAVVKKFTELNYRDQYLGLSPLDVAKLAHRYLSGVLAEEDWKIIEALLRYKSIRRVACKLFGGLEKRRVVRRALCRALFELVRRGVVKVDRDALQRLAEVSKFWERAKKELEGGLSGATLPEAT